MSANILKFSVPRKKRPSAQHEKDASHLKQLKKNRFGGHAALFIFNSEITLRTTRESSRTTSGTRTTLWEPLV